MEIIRNHLSINAKMPRWPSNGDYSEGIRCLGLKLPLANDMLHCQVTMTANTLLTSCLTKKAPVIQYLQGTEITPDPGARKIEETGLEPNGSSSSHRCKVSVLMVGRNRWREEKKLIYTIEALNAQLGCFNIELSNTGPPPEVKIKDGKVDQVVENGIRDNITMMIKNTVNAVVVLLPSKSRPLYEYIKSLYELRLAFYSVCIDASKFAGAENDKGYYFQTALKVNIKTGGQNQVGGPGASKAIDLDSTLIVGIDIMSPPKKATDGANGTILMVASIKSDLSQWPAAVRITDKQPMHQGLSNLFATRIDLWKQKNEGRLQKRIIIYHNGLSEKGCTPKIKDFRHIIEREAREAKLTLLAVKKDYHTKL